MTHLTKAMTGVAAAALATLSAAPAQAQSYPYDPYGRDYGRSGVDVGSIVRGVAVAGAAAAAVGAITNAVRGGVYGNGGYGNGGYGYPSGGGYGYPNSGGYGYPSGTYGNGAYGNDLQRYAVDSCARRASQYGQVQVTQVRPRSNTSLRVEGVAGNAYNAGWGYARSERRAFQCDVRSDGRITYFDTDRIRS